MTEADDDNDDNLIVSTETSEIKYDESQAKLIEANKKLKEEEQWTKYSLEKMLDPKQQSKIFRQKLSKYNRPIKYVIFAFIFGLVAGMVAPMFGVLMIKNLTTIMFADICNKVKKIAS